MKNQHKTPSPKQQAHIEEAWILYQSGRLAEAEHSFKALFKHFPAHPQILTGRGLTAIKLGHFTEAIKWLDKSLNIAPAQEEALLNLGIALAISGQFDPAITCFNRLIIFNPNSAEAYGNRANAYVAINLLDDALLSFTRAITLKPDYPEAHYNLANLLMNIGHMRSDYGLVSSAIKYFDQAIAGRTNFPEAYNNRGNALKMITRFDHALLDYDQAIRLRPNFVEAQANIGVVLDIINKLDNALAEPDNTIAPNDADGEAYNNHGNYLFNQKQYDRALACYARATLLKPLDPVARYNHGLALHELKRFEEALTSYDKAITLNPEMVEPFNNRGNVLKELRQLTLAEQSYNQAMKVNPEYADAYWNKSLLKLQMGDYEQGWQLYEWRWKSPNNEKPRFTEKPLWLGESTLTDKTLLVHFEQGLGDFIQFCRYIPLLEARGAKVILETPPALLTLIKTLSNQTSLVAAGQPMADFDMQCPIMSLPLAFKTQLDSVPANIPYLSIAKDTQSQWRERLGNKTAMRVGLMWSGSTTHKDDWKRSIPFSQLKPLLSLPFEFHALQKEFRQEDAEFINFLDQLQTHHVFLQDFNETAALIAEMDIIITVDTAVAHVAGALGKQVWLLLAHSPDYRWLLDTDQTPWYPTVTLFRQPAKNDWNSVIAQVGQHLLALQASASKVKPKKPRKTATSSTEI